LYLYLEKKIENEKKDIFWDHFLQLKIFKEKYKDNKEKYVKKVMDKYLDLVILLIMC